MELTEKLEQMPNSPGVYLMRDAEGDIIYIGKARNLRQRVRQYFSVSGDSRPHIRFLVARISDIEVILTDTEKEALLLENTLIKQHKPRYNLNLKDDKTYFSLRIDLREAFPRFNIIRKVTRDGARYFGPYASATAAKEVLRQLQRMFPLRHYPLTRCMSRNRPCLYHQIGQCSAPCQGLISSEEYATLVNGSILFLEGKNRELLAEFKRRMQQAAEELRFEEATRWRNLLQSIQVTVEKQKMVTQGGDSDIIGFHRLDSRIQLTMLCVRGGTMSNSRQFELQWELENDQAISEFIRCYYTNDVFIPGHIYLPLEIEAPQPIADMLSDIKGSKVQLSHPVRGTKRELVELANKNAAALISERSEKEASMAAVLDDLRKYLHLSKLPLRMECYDISNLQGRFSVGSGTVFIGGRPDKSLYRHYRIQQVDGQNDFAMLSEVFARRFRQDNVESYGMPDLVVVDGGIGQLNAALEIVRGLGIESSFDIISLAKSRVTANSSDSRIRKSDERVFLPGRRNPVVLKQNSAPLLLLAALRDEAHRFAIEYHRKLRSKDSASSELENIEGVGRQRRTALLRHFGSLKKLQQASIEEIAMAEGIHPAMAARIYAHLHRKA